MPTPRADRDRLRQSSRIQRLITNNETDRRQAEPEITNENSKEGKRRGIPCIMQQPKAPRRAKKLAPATYPAVCSLCTFTNKICDTPHAIKRPLCFAAEHNIPSQTPCSSLCSPL
ncbi:hypothetical protein CB0940_03221 [Cercospora beticola]|uniref:Uncharacterized protein n=1 Tax=Cercospora beticola TaxID=122368 RepID=A0A2G5I540_CERBT|nr:hypothetical protein CB0940_03221 [Cercospora beticola]PIA99612.1 hypothetical protein CB0940_03221 [Cercospora beticola]CAK1361397.1 unnamed protein product [Cercospora beticola]